jgi:hypothetical protein
MVGVEGGDVNKVLGIALELENIAGKQVCHPRNRYVIPATGVSSLQQVCHPREGGDPRLIKLLRRIQRGSPPSRG